MASCFIVSRSTKGGRKHVVRYRLGGRTWPIQHGGSFQTQKEAKKRRDLIAGEIAAGRNPADLLASIAAAPEAAVTVSDWRDRFLSSRLDIDENTVRNYRVALKKACERFGDTDPATITWQDVAEWISALVETHKPGTIRLYKTHFSVLLDYIGLDPNPAKDSRVKVPKRVTEEPNPPTAEHFFAILDAIPQLPRRVLFLVMEQGALRLGEAVGLRWGDVDRAGLRLRLPKSQTKRDRARWVYLPEWLMAALDDLCPVEDRTPSGASSRASLRRPHIRPCSGLARPQGSRTTTRTICGTAGSRFGTNPASSHANLQSAQDIRAPASRSTSTRTSCRSRRRLRTCSLASLTLT